MKVLIISIRRRLLNFELEVEPTDLVENVIQMIESKENIPVKAQRLLFKGRILKCSRSLEDCEIQNESRIFLILREPLVPIFLYVTPGDDIELKIKLSSSVDCLKEKVYERGGYPPDRQQYFFRGQRLTGDNSLSEYEIKPGSRLSLVISSEHADTFA